MKHNFDDVVKKSPYTVCYSVWPYALHTTCMPSRMTKTLCLVYEDFYLSIGSTFYGFINFGETSDLNKPLKIISPVSTENAGHSTQGLI